jgi:hypothetical protein
LTHPVTALRSPGGHDRRLYTAGDHDRDPYAPVCGAAA